MKKIMIVLAALLLTGCKAEPVFETLGDVHGIVSVAAASEVAIVLPENAALGVMENEEADKLYFCDGYTVTVQTLEAGDLNKTLQAVTGYTREELTLMQTQKGNCNQYECVWTSAGEGTEQVGRLCLLDDGVWHYAVVCMSDAGKAGSFADQWQCIMDSITLH